MITWSVFAERKHRTERRTLEFRACFQMALYLIVKDRRVLDPVPPWGHTGLCEIRNKPGASSLWIFASDVYS